MQQAQKMLILSFFKDGKPETSIAYYWGKKKKKKRVAPSPTNSLVVKRTGKFSRPKFITLPIAVRQRNLSPVCHPPESLL